MLPIKFSYLESPPPITNFPSNFEDKYFKIYIIIIKFKII